jgi:hypothetical protein
MFVEQLQSEAVLELYTTNLPVFCSTFEANSTLAIFLADKPGASSKTFASHTHAFMYA